MIHAPCGAAGNFAAPCMEGSRSCTKDFPKQFRTHTELHDGWVRYRRRPPVYPVGGKVLLASDDDASQAKREATVLSRSGDMYILTCDDTTLHDIHSTRLSWSPNNDIEIDHVAILRTYHHTQRKHMDTAIDNSWVRLTLYTYTHLHTITYALHHGAYTHIITGLVAPHSPRRLSLTTPS